MKKIIFIVLLALMACGPRDPAQKTRKSHPSHKYTHIQIDSNRLRYYETNYVPVYSNIYDRDGTKKFMLTTTISIRNTSFIDSAILLSATYHDSYGKILSEYIDSSLLVSPLESIEFVVEEFEKVGGAGANFIIEWAATRYSDQLMIQAIMISSQGQQGISFLSEARIIDQRFKE